MANNDALSIKFYAVHFTAQNMSFRSPRYPANKARAAADHYDLKPEHMNEFGYVAAYRFGFSAAADYCLAISAKSHRK
ncbi:hypothetical protein [Allorhizobium taibaishanense]|uniref:Uncharacterized protein n=1 Tax=Allorhizobium taibaishanense TaxID=887144 RepID=A0A7W6HQ77_9HYPH|nr:hypothetical protein [Allorhizobium taibaishanense]MBB4009397.1 hypothetical protein [Allorhizobium taibaishanense]